MDTRRLTARRQRTVRDAARAELRRSALARVRLSGLAEFVTVGMAAGIGWAEVANPSGGWPVVVMFGAVALAVRIAVAVEFVVADRDGIAWRSLFRRDSASWDHVSAIGLGRMRLFPGRGRGDECIEVTFANGATRRLRASAWCGSRARLEFIAAATVLHA